LETDFFRIACREQVATVERVFNSRLRCWPIVSPRLKVYAFASRDALEGVHGSRVGGFACHVYHEIAVALDIHWGEILRHELAHIFAARWNPRPLPFLCEGLAVWVQRTMNGYAYDVGARVERLT